jgi:undecaprenyl-diphosphatase
MHAVHPPLLDPGLSPPSGVLRWHRWLLVAGMLLATGLGLHGQDRDVFETLNMLGRHVPTLWAMLSVAGLGLSAFIGLTAAQPGNTPRAMRVVAALLWCFPIGGALTHLFKQLINQPRPAAVLAPDQLVVIGEPLLRGAMPSGHAVTTLAVVGLLLSRARPLGQRLALGLAALVVVLARITVGAHWPADVCVGASLGLITAVTAWTLSARPALPRWLGSPAGQMLLAVTQIVCGWVMARLDSGYPAALPLQWTLGVLSVAAGLYRLRTVRLTLSERG